MEEKAIIPEIVENNYDKVISLAIEQKADLATIEKFMDLRDRWEKNEARKAYFLALSEFKKEIICVKKDKENKQYSSKYASEDSLMNTVNPILGKYGLSATFEFDQTNPDLLKVTCFLTHSSGHREAIFLSGGLDKSGAKNPLQQLKSTDTYLRKALYSAITGISASNDDADDDGNSSSEIKYLTEAEAVTIISIVTDKQVDLKKFLAYMNAESIEKILGTDYQKAIQALKVAKGAKK